MALGRARKPLQPSGRLPVCGGGIQLRRAGAQLALHALKIEQLTMNLHGTSSDPT